MDVEALIFDFGDTIVTLDPSREQIVAGFLATKAVNASLENIRCAYRTVDYCHKQSVLRLTDQLEKKEFLLKINSEILKFMGLSKEADSWSLELYQYFQRKKRWQLFPDVQPTLDRLTKLGYRKAILANWDNSLEEQVKRLGVDQYFSYIFSSEDLSMEKPDPDIFRHALKVIAACPENAVYVGNEYEVDVVGARDAGLIPILIDRSGFWPQADCLRFEGLTALANYLEA